MRIEKYDPEKHYSEVCEWFEKRGITPLPECMLSTNGAIVPGVAVGFLYCTDSTVTYLDHYIANPLADDKKRAKAIETITINLIMWAKEFGSTHIVTDSKIKTIQKFALDFGFKSFGFSQKFMKEL